MLKLLLWLTFGGCLLVSIASVPAWIFFSPHRNLEQTGGIDLVLAFDASQLPPGADRQALAKDTIEVLRKRADPQGLKGIVWRVKDGTQIEIQAPYPSAAARQARADRAQALAALDASWWRAPELANLAAQAAKADTPEHRAALLKQFVDTHLAAGGTSTASPSGATQSAGFNRAREEALQKLEVLAQAEKSFADIDARLAAVRPADWKQSDITARDTAKRALDDATDDARALSLDSRQCSALMAAAETGNSAAQKSLAALADRYPLQAQPVEALLKARRTELVTTGGVDDVAELRRLAAIGGVVDFRISVLPSEISATDLLVAREGLKKYGPAEPAHVNGTTARWFGILPNGREYLLGGGYVTAIWADEPYILLYDDHDHTLTHADPRRMPWRVSGGKPAEDPGTGGVYLPFTLDAIGGNYMGALTSSNLKHPLAILLDARVLTAPTIQSQINANGQITFGSVSATHPLEEKMREAQDLKLVLDAGALPAALNPVPVSIREIPPNPNYHPFPWQLVWTLAPLPIAALALVLLLKTKPRPATGAVPQP